MNPHLLVLAGPLKGQTFELSDGELTLGREDSNSVCLKDPRVSRRHAIIESRGQPFTPVDLDSSNGTFVNGLPVTQHTLEHGDQIEIGGTLLLFALHEEQEAPDPLLMDSDPKTIVGRAAVQLHPEDCVYLTPTPERAPTGAPDRMAGD